MSTFWVYFYVLKMKNEFQRLLRKFVTIIITLLMTLVSNFSNANFVVIADDEIDNNETTEITQIEETNVEDNEYIVEEDKQEEEVTPDVAENNDNEEINNQEEIIEENIQETINEDENKEEVIDENKEEIVEEDKQEEVTPDVAEDNNDNEEINNQEEDNKEEVLQEEIIEENKQEEVVEEDIEVIYPEFNESKTIDDVNINVYAPEGVFPENVTLSIEKVSNKTEEEVNALIDEVREVEKNVAVSYTFDIKVLDEI